MAKQFVNAPEALVDEAIEGLLRGSGGTGLARLNAPEGIRVVLRDPLPEGEVAVLSGGGSGHEPAHAGFVGDGMLTAAICGDIFASPPVEAVLAGIRAVTGPQGCLLIVKNYTGDRLNFGLAAERARSEGLKVEMVIVADDIALPDNEQPRGLAGTLFVHKVAGWAAREGKPLDEVADLARRTADGVRSIGLALAACTVPGASDEIRIAADEVELGLGIHGEPGAETVGMERLDGLVRHLTERLSKTAGDGELALLVNTLGGVSSLEELALARAALTSHLAERVALVVGPAPAMTSLDMRGVSLTVLPLQSDLRTALMAPVGPRAWPTAREMAAPRLVEMPDAPETAADTPSDHPERRALIEAACTAIEEMAPDLDALDAKVGDGDTGVTFAAGARDIAGRLDKLPLDDLPALFSAIGRALSARAGGSSGVLLSILFSAAGQAAADGASTADALMHGVSRMKDLGGANRGDRTMIDALEPALDALADGDLERASAAARKGADETAGMARAGAGRSAYVPESDLKGTKDPGAEAVARLFEVLAKR